MRSEDTPQMAESLQYSSTNCLCASVGCPKGDHAIYDPTTNLPAHTSEHRFLQTQMPAGDASICVLVARSGGGGVGWGWGGGGVGGWGGGGGGVKPCYELQSCPKHCQRSLAGQVRALKPLLKPGSTPNKLVG